MVPKSANPIPPADTEEELSTILQIVYASAATVPFSEDELIELLRISKANNDAAGITGMLLYHEGSFIQAIEGEPEVVERLYRKIARDRRHGDTLLLHRGEAQNRTFGGWSMGFERLSLDGHGHVPGLNRFLRSGVLGLRTDDGDAVRRAMLGFRAGKYRRGH